MAIQPRTRRKEVILSWTDDGAFQGCQASDLYDLIDTDTGEPVPMMSPRMMGPRVVTRDDLDGLLSDETAGLVVAASEQAAVLVVLRKEIETLRLDAENATTAMQAERKEWSADRAGLMRTIDTLSTQWAQAVGVADSQATDA